MPMNFEDDIFHSGAGSAQPVVHQYSPPFVISEANHKRSRATATLTGPVTVVERTVLDARIVIYPATVAEEKTLAIAILARDAEVDGKLLRWPPGYTLTQKSTAIAALAAQGVIVR